MRSRSIESGFSDGEGVVFCEEAGARCVVAGICGFGVGNFRRAAIAAPRGRGAVRGSSSLGSRRISSDAGGAFDDPAHSNFLRRPSEMDSLQSQ